jgi:hypothetical protein
VAGVLGAALLVFFMLALGGIVELGTIIGSAAALVLTPVLLLRGKRRGAAKLLAVWGIYITAYLGISTGMVMLKLRFERTRGLGQEVCADSGCCGVDKVDRRSAGTNDVYTLFWHLASTDKEMTKRFPGRELEVYMFDEKGSKFHLAADADQNPLDITVPAGQIVRKSLEFTVPANIQKLFLTAEYRAFTFQSFFPGTISLLPHRPPAIIRIK